MNAFAATTQRQQPPPPPPPPHFLFPDGSLLKHFSPSLPHGPPSPFSAFPFLPPSSTPTTTTPASSSTSLPFRFVGVPDAFANKAAHTFNNSKSFAPPPPPPPPLGAPSNSSEELRRCSDSSEVPHGDSQPSLFTHRGHTFSAPLWRSADRPSDVNPCFNYPNPGATDTYRRPSSSHASGGSMGFNDVPLPSAQKSDRETFVFGSCPVSNGSSATTRKKIFHSTAAKAAGIRARRYVDIHSGKSHASRATGFQSTNTLKNTSVNFATNSFCTSNASFTHDSFASKEAVNAPNVASRETTSIPDRFRFPAFNSAKDGSGSCFVFHGKEYQNQVPDFHTHKPFMKSVHDRQAALQSSSAWGIFPESSETDDVSKASTKVTSLDDGLSRPILEDTRPVELTEFNLNSPYKSQIDELQEKFGKLGRGSEEVNKQKENQEPNFTYDNSILQKPFIFQASKSSNARKANPNSDDLDRNESASRNSKKIEILVEELDKKMEKLGTFGENIHEPHVSGREGGISEGIDDSISHRVKDSEKMNIQKEKDARRVQSFLEESLQHIMTRNPSNTHKERFPKCDFSEHGNRSVTKEHKAECHCKSHEAIKHSIEELRRQVEQLRASSNKGRDAIEQSIEELCRQVEKLGYLGNEMKQQNMHHVPATEPSVDDLATQLSKLGRFSAGENNRKHKTKPSGNNFDPIAHSVEELRQNIAKLWKDGNEVKAQSHPATNGSESTANVYTSHRAEMETNEECAEPSFQDEVSSKVNRFQEQVREAFVFGSHINIGIFSSAAPTASISCPGVGNSNCVERTKNSSSVEEVPIGEFTTVSSGESSASESSFTQNDASEVRSHDVPIFEFQGNTTINVGLPRKTENMRSHGHKHAKRSINRQKKGSIFKEGPVSTSDRENTACEMDFSPYKAEDPSASVEGTKYKAQGDSVTGDVGFAASNIDVGRGNNFTDQEPLCCDNITNENGSHVSHQRKGKWKRIYKNEQDNHVIRTDPQRNRDFTFGPRNDSDMVQGEGIENIVTPSDKMPTNKVPERRSVSIQGVTFLINEKKDGQKNGSFMNSRSDIPSLKDPWISTTPTATKSNSVEQVCEGWRLRGNQAYAHGDFQKAEDFYSRGIGVAINEAHFGCRKSSLLCYSNRAAARMALGRMREALEDCQQAMVLDNRFLRARLRAASCHLALGENDLASKSFKECLNHAKDMGTVDSKISEEVLNGIKKSEELDAHLEMAKKLSQAENFADKSAALSALNEALAISPYSESVLELKAGVLFMLRQYTEVLKLCQESLPSAEDNHVYKQQDEASANIQRTALNIWRWRMCGKSLFHLGKLEDCIDFLVKFDQAVSNNLVKNVEDIDAIQLLIANARDLLRFKAAGNQAFLAGRHAEAIEHYTAALACNSESRPYSAVCFCNRAAASQAMGQIADAIADCSRAIVLDSTYAKAISRRATLHEIIRDYDQTCTDLRRLIALLEGLQSNSQQTRNTQDLQQARTRLEKMNDEFKKDYLIDHYLILGLDRSCTADDVKKAYRKAALKHHPDKAGQFLMRAESGDQGSFWKEVSDEVHRDAERLFKLIGEAYGVLSDPAKRTRYDSEERKSRSKKGSSGAARDDYSHSPYEKTSRRQRNHSESWTGYHYQRWQNEPDVAEQDTFSHRGSRTGSASKSSRNRNKNEYYYY